MKSLVLLSGGLDSTIALAAARKNSEIVLALTFDYGQRAAEREIQAAKAIARHYGVKHQVIILDFLGIITQTSLVNRSVDIPKPTADQLDDRNATSATASQVWVPNRNGVFINIAAAFCEVLECAQIVVGFNAEEGAAFPDNTAEFMDAATLALGYSTQRGVRVVSPTVKLTKQQMGILGKELAAPLQLIWSCYDGAEIMCGECESCQRLKRALTSIGLDGRVTFGC